LVVAGLTGGEMDSFLQITELLFKECMSNPREHECWCIHINIVHLLQQESFTANDLNNLKRLTKRWKYLMVKLYSGIAKRQQATNSNRTQPKKKSCTTKPTTNSNEAMMTMTMSEKLLSFKFPNFNKLQHWSELIHFLGPLWVQDMRLWEQRHLAAKMTVNMTIYEGDE
jgi:hypothetical protein